MLVGVCLNSVDQHSARFRLLPTSQHRSAAHKAFINVKDLVFGAHLAQRSYATAHKHINADNESRLAVMNSRLA
ncbi:unnamed protein product, partial [Ceratitis capitata]